MALLNSTQIFDKIKTLVGDKDDDETLTFLTDMKETITAYEGKNDSDGEDWKAKYDENDKAWRQRYKDAFFSGTPTPLDTKIEDNANKQTPDPEKTKEETITYNDLFSDGTESAKGGSEDGNKAD